MENFCIQTSDLSFRFSPGEIVLDKINLNIPEGVIYGFLGPNGAGKTTTLKLILGLLKKQEGNIRVFGKEFESNRLEILQQTGSLIESPSLYAHLNARDNLKIWQLVYNCSETRINEVLELVGIAHTGKKKTGQFSLGMKQRLSIAIALLHNPSLLILDEPSNGLDPSGIVEMRELLVKINRELKTTIVISSHLLSEIEKTVTHLGIINKGKLLFEGKLSELQLKQTMGAYIAFETSMPEKTYEILQLQGFNPKKVNDLVTIPLIEKKRVAGINEKLVNAGIEVYLITQVNNDLESIFIDITK